MYRYGPVTKCNPFLHGLARAVFRVNHQYMYMYVCVDRRVLAPWQAPAANIQSINELTREYTATPHSCRASAAILSTYPFIHARLYLAYQRLGFPFSRESTRAERI